MELKTIIGKRVRQLREHRSLTQAELADKADLSPRYIGYIERGKRLLSTKAAERIAAALKVPVYQLFADSKDLFLSMPECNALVESAPDLENNLSRLLKFVQSISGSK